MKPAVFTPASAVTNLRRSTVLGLVLSAIAIAICTAQGHPLAGVFGLLGIVVGAFNNYALQRSVIRFAEVETVTRKKFAGSVLMRLAAVTLVAIAIALLMRPDGLGIFVGLAAFQALMLIGAAIPVFRYLRPSS